jgi:hypothetical protein
MRSGVGLLWLIGATLAGATSGCGIHLAQTPPPPMKPIRDVAREEKGEVLNVRDTKLDLSTGRGAPLRTSAPVGVGPFGVPVPITIGGEKKKEVPAEEITVRLASGRMIAIVQELSSPPFAPGERVRVLFEQVDDPGTTPRMQVVRD